MSTSAKIRLLLALLFISLLFTAIIAQKTYTPKNNLVQTAQILENHLHKKENIVDEILTNRKSFDQFRNIEDSAYFALNKIKAITNNNSIWFITLKDNQLAFWSGIKIIPQNPEKIKDGHSFLKYTNGYYETIKKTEGNFSVLFFIPVKINYAFQNKYLKNTFSPELLNDNNIELADFTDKVVYDVHSIDHSYLFSVKLNKNGVNHRFFYYELTVWLLCFITLGVLVNSGLNYLANKGYIFTSFLLLAIFITAVRVLNLHFGWPNFTFTPELFSPQLYHSNPVYPSLGDFCINILLLTWFVLFIYQYRRKIVHHPPGKPLSYGIFLGGIAVLIFASTALLGLFESLVTSSNINFDINNVFNLSVFSLLGVLMLCFSFLIFYILSEIFLSLIARIDIPLNTQLCIFAASMIVATVAYTRWHEFTMFYTLWGILVVIRGYNHKFQKGRLNAISLICIIIISSWLAAVKLNHFKDSKERETRKSLVQKLEAPDDVVADYIFKRIENDITKDPFIIQYFNKGLHNSVFLKNYFERLYFDGYLSKYDFTIHEYNSTGKGTIENKGYNLEGYKDLVMYGSYKVSNFFYRDNASFGYHNYFAILPIFKDDIQLGTLIIELRSRSIHPDNAFPELLVAGYVNQTFDNKNYSYALYTDDKLLNQSGNYAYNLTNTQFKVPVKQYAYLTTNSDTTFWGSFRKYSHLVYKPSENHLIIISKQEDALFHTITSITFFFIVFLCFSFIVLVVRWFWTRIRILYVKDSFFHWSFKLTLDKVLYKTRIQFSMVFAVVITLILVSVITYFSIGRQYQNQQDNMIRDKIIRIAKVLESTNLVKNLKDIDEETENNFNELAGNFAVDLSLFNSNGDKLISTQPKLYEGGLIAPKMNRAALINLQRLQKSEYVNEERIGLLNYKSAYVPLRNTKNETVAYLQLPYFSNVADYQERIGSLLNAMINIYAIVFIGIGFFAVIIARQITSPLSFIQQSLSKTIYGQKNELIHWERNDEIGALIKEYNKMIAALEHSAAKLAQSERESAWREMAKQVAHEIKNPLTPLKLGLQLLEKSWRDKDTRFDQKFERFSKSFVEQIESLSNIASEFSAFAKMPDTRIERINIFDMLSQAVIIFKQMDNVSILYVPHEEPFHINADRDQLLRCFNNLLKNAIEATPTERRCIIEINYLLTSKDILLSVKDNGNGIPDDMHEKIFEPNFTTKSSGTGLGLAFVKNSVENAGGKVWFETVVGTGTTFYFSLPGA